ncbi:CX3C chemokine receptor 1-like [Physella acuta]|uniref:CX3C chemokine receptor 1-like n=1 Tax=Physella acuta TaxID=109671 RepID=UPI0027DBC1E1|nr:CX3C chemokine receptor 1-like [Physella acuta]
MEFVAGQSSHENNTAVLAEVERITSITNDIVLLSYSMMLTVGVPGNILTVIVLSKKKMRDTVFSVYLISMCGLNIILLVTMFSFTVTRIVHPNLLTQHQKLCVVMKFFYVYFMMLSSWYVVIITACRFFYLVQRTKQLTTCNPLVVLIITTLALAAVTIPLIVDGIVFISHSGEEVECYLQHTTYHVKVLAGLQLLIPALLLFFLNGGLLYLHFRTHSGLMSTEQSSKIRQQLVVLVVLSNIQFLVTSTPILVLYTNMTKWFDIDSALGEARSKFWLNITLVILYSNNATNFFIYCFFGKRFRAELVRTVRRWFGLFIDLDSYDSEMETRLGKESGKAQENVTSVPPVSVAEDTKSQTVTEKNTLFTTEMKSEMTLMKRPSRQSAVDPESRFYAESFVSSSEAID